METKRGNNARSLQDMTKDIPNHSPVIVANVNKDNENSAMNEQLASVNEGEMDKNPEVQPQKGANCWIIPIDSFDNFDMLFKYLSNKS